MIADSDSPRTGALGLQARQKQETDCKIHQTRDSLDVEGEVEGGVGDDCGASILCDCGDILNTKLLATIS